MSAFQFDSVFRYNALSNFDQLDDPLEVTTTTNRFKGSQTLFGITYDIQLIVHYLIVVAFYLIFIITFPISAIFCVKRISSLQRCIIFRLGLRMPLKGPGLVISFPCIDSIEIIDLSDQQITIVDKDQQLLTSDGSIIQFISFIGTLNVTNAIKSSTQLKDAKFNCKQFVKLSFANMIGSVHIDDIETDIEIILKKFEQNCNSYLNNWGWNIKIEIMPKYVIIDRANPINPLLTALKGIFNYQTEQQHPNGSDNIFSKLFKSQTSMSCDTIKHESDNYNDYIIPALESIANKYSNYVFHDLYIAIEIEEINSIQYFIFIRKLGKIERTEKPNQIHINIISKTKSDLMLFCSNGDTNKVIINSSLF